MTPQHRSEKPQNLWRGIVAWLLCHPEILTKQDRRLCEELISLVVITDKQRGELTDVLGRAIAATGIPGRAALGAEVKTSPFRSDYPKAPPQHEPNRPKLCD
jgi:hypothetical protein